MKIKLIYLIILSKNIKEEKYKKKDPIYFYFDTDNKTYRYTCENKNYKIN